LDEGYIEATGAPTIARPTDNIRSSASITLSVWNAIFLREAVSRVSGGRAAWVWLLVEPVAHLTILMVVLSAIRHGITLGMDFALFLAIGILGYNLFRMRRCGRWLPSRRIVRYLPIARSSPWMWCWCARFWKVLFSCLSG
jgi:hypothetical protein